MTITIKDIPVLERPRERLINFGVSKLNNEELLAIILKSGTKDQSAKLLASQLLQKINCINDLNTIKLEQLKEIKGIGDAKASFLLASIELGKRLNQSIVSLKGQKMLNAKQVFEYYKNIIGSELQEKFYCLYLNNNKVIIGDKLLFIGTINQSLVHPRDIFKEAYLVSASSIICLHNHPSGNIIPSNEDIDMTCKIVEIGYLLGIRVIDHIILSSDKYYSFLENGHI